MGSPLVGRDGPYDEEHDSGADWQSPAIGCLENGQKEGRITTGVVASLAVIVAMAVVMGGLKIEISAR